MGKKCYSTSSSCSDSECPKSESDCKKCSSVSNYDSSQFRRLQLLLSHWSAVAMGNTELHSTLVIDFSGEHIHTYSGTTSTNGEHTHDWTEGGTTSAGSHTHDYSGNVDISGLHRHSFSRIVRNPVSRDGQVVNVPESIMEESNAITAFNFIWSHRNLLIEKCGKNQLWGWVVDFSNGDLKILQDTDGILWQSSKTRAEIYDTSCNSLSLFDKKTKSVLDRLFEMSENVVRCNKYPDTEGNLVEVSDKCGQKWMVAVNLTKPASNTVYEEEPDNEHNTVCHADEDEEPNENSGIFSRVENGRYVFVACKL